MDGYVRDILVRPHKSGAFHTARSVLLNALGARALRGLPQVASPWCRMCSLIEDIV